MAKYCCVFFALIFLALLLHARARPMPATGVDPASSTAADQKTFLPCIPRVPKVFAANAVAQNVETSTFDVAPSPGAGLKEGKNFIYGGGVGGYAGYAGFVGGFPVLGGIHYGGIGGVGGIGGLGGAAGGGIGGGAGGAGGLLPCP